MRGILLLALLVCGPVVGQEPAAEPAPVITVTTTESVSLGDWVRVAVATEGTGLLVRVRQVLPGEDLDVSTGLLPLRAAGEYAFTNPRTGGYVIEAQAVVDGEIVTAHGYTRIGPVQPPPGPDPPPDPPPVVAGPRNVLILHETADTTPAFAQSLVDLRAGEPAKYLADNKHRLWILDDDDADPKWLQVIEGVTLPAVVILDERNQVIHKGACPARAADVIALIKQHGG